MEELLLPDEEPSDDELSEEDDELSDDDEPSEDELELESLAPESLALRPPFP